MKWASLHPSCLGLCASWTCMSISFTKSGKFSFIIFQIDFQFLALSLLLLAPLWYECWISWSCPRDCLHYPYFFGFFSSSCSDWLFFTSLCSKSLIWFWVSSTLLLFPKWTFHVSINQFIEVGYSFQVAATAYLASTVVSPRNPTWPAGRQRQPEPLVPGRSCIDLFNLFFLTISASILIISSVYTLGFVCSSFSSSFRCKVRLFEIFLVAWCGLYCHKFPSETCFDCVLYFGSLCFHFHLSRGIMISSLTSQLIHSLFSSMMFSIRVFVCFPVFFLSFSPSFIPLWSQMLDMISSS